MTIPENEYGNEYKSHLLEQYKLYVEMADNISERRQTANSFFLSINTAIVGLSAYLSICDTPKKVTILFTPISIAGMIICYMWYRLVRSYMDLNTAKFKVVHEIEQKLPFAPYDVEWDKVGRGADSKLYLPFTHIEKYVPWIFLFLHLFVLGLIIYETVNFCGMIQEADTSIYSTTCPSP